jgi:predicted Zn-dependent peptidase
VTSLFNMADHYRKIDAATIRGAAQKYLNPANMVKVTLFPEKTVAPDLPLAASR